jgi:hypothetical protein
LTLLPAQFLHTAQQLVAVVVVMEAISMMETMEVVVEIARFQELMQVELLSI